MKNDEYRLILAAIVDKNNNCVNCIPHTEGKTISRQESLDILCDSICMIIKDINKSREEQDYILVNKIIDNIKKEFVSPKNFENVSLEVEILKDKKL
jgi:hypothetical protein